MTPSVGRPNKKLSFLILQQHTLFGSLGFGMTKKEPISGPQTQQVQFLGRGLVTWWIANLNQTAVTALKAQHLEIKPGSNKMKFRWTDFKIYSS